jgi:hypothetical protein
MENGALNRLALDHYPMHFPPFQEVDYKVKNKKIVFCSRLHLHSTAMAPFSLQERRGLGTPGHSPKIKLKRQYAGC